MPVYFSFLSGFFAMFPELQDSCDFPPLLFLKKLQAVFSGRPGAQCFFIAGEKLAVLFPAFRKRGYLSVFIQRREEI